MGQKSDTHVVIGLNDLKNSLLLEKLLGKIDFTKLGLKNPMFSVIKREKQNKKGKIGTPS